MSAGFLSGLRFRRSAVTPRSRGYAGQVISLEVNVRDIERIPIGLRKAYEEMLTRLEVALVANYREHVPGDPMGRLGRQVAAKRLRKQVVVGTWGSEFAKALNRGFTATAKKGKALRFEINGEVIYRKRVRVPGKHFHEAAIATTPPIVEAIYEMSFFRVEDLA